MRSKSVAQTWRAFSQRERRQIEARLTKPDGSRCPRCGDILESRPSMSGAVLQCRECLRFHTRPQHNAETLYLLRIERLATAILSA